MADPLPADFSQRTRTAIVLIGVLVALEVLAHYFCVGRWLLLLVGMLAVARAAYEGALLTATHDLSRRRILLRQGSFLLPALLMAGWAIREGICDQILWSGAAALLGGMAVAGALLLGELFYEGRSDLEQVQSGAAPRLILFLLIGCGGGGLIALTTTAQAPIVLVWLFAVVCCNDIAAYVAGSRYGTVKLAPAISPKKTVLGSGAGLVAGTAIGVLLSGLLDGFGYGLVSTAGIAALVTVAAQLGDLSKSFAKRTAGVKDSGALLPGHGGVLDRLDGVFGAALCMLALFQ